MGVEEGGGDGLRNASSPIPYLFTGLALMLALIAIALLILACSYRNASSSTSVGDEEKPAKTMVDKEEVDSEPKIVVIMAGDSNPTYLAKPLSSSTCHSTAEQAV